MFSFFRICWFFFAVFQLLLLLLLRSLLLLLLWLLMLLFLRNLQSSFSYFEWSIQCHNNQFLIGHVACGFCYCCGWFEKRRGVRCCRDTQLKFVSIVRHRCGLIELESSFICGWCNRRIINLCERERDANCSYHACHGFDWLCTYLIREKLLNNVIS